MSKVKLLRCKAENRALRQAYLRLRSDYEKLESKYHALINSRSQEVSELKYCNRRCYECR